LSSFNIDSTTITIHTAPYTIVDGWWMAVAVGGDAWLLVMAGPS